MDDIRGDNFPPPPDDFWNDSANWNTPDLDSFVWGDTGFDDTPDDIFAFAGGLAFDEEYDSLEDIFMRDDDDDDDDDDYEDDLDPFLEREIYRWWNDPFYDDDPEYDDRLSDVRVIPSEGAGFDPNDKDVRGPFPDIDEVYSYLDDWGGWRFLQEIVFDVFTEEYYIVLGGSA
jgi:hypothetical protein